MNISSINLNNFKFQNAKLNKTQKQTNSIQKQNLLLPTTAQYLAFMGGYSVNLGQTFENLKDDEYPNDIQEMVLDEIEKGNPNNKTLYDVHFEKYEGILDCFSLEELKEKYPEFSDVKSAFEVSAKPDSFIGKFQNGENEIFANSEDLTLQLIKLYWGQGFSLNGLSNYIADLSQDKKGIQLNHTLEKLNIPLMNRKYARVLQLSNKEYNENFTSEMSRRLKETREFKKQQQEGEPVFIPKGPLSESRRQHISQGLKKHYQEHPEKIYAMSKRQKEFYEQHPEKKQEFSQVLDYAWHNTKEGVSLAKHISKFAKKYYNLEITIDELSLKKEMNPAKRNTLGAFWERNKWANKQLSIAMTKGWENVKTDNRSVEEIYNYKTIPNEQLVVDLIPEKVRMAMEKWITNQGYDLKDFIFCKAIIHRNDDIQAEELQELVNEKSQKLTNKYIDSHAGLANLIADSMQSTIVDVMRDLSNKSLKLPREIRKDETKLTALMLIFSEHMKDAPLYRVVNNNFIPIIGRDIGYLNNLYVHMINYAYMMDCEDFARYMNAKFNEQFEKLYNENPVKLN